jgi:hypothetical protein
LGTVSNTTLTAFLTRGTPTFVVGTTGDDRSDRVIRGQVALIQGLAFSASAAVTDTDALAAWPDHAVVYGGPHVNALVAKIAPCLPFKLSAGQLEIGGQKFADDTTVIFAVIPARPAAGDCPGHPEFLLFAGTGTPGVAEINSPHLSREDEPITIADAFGRITGGSWGTGGAELAAPAARVTWSRAQVQKAGVTITVALPPDGQTVDAGAVEAALRGVESAVKKLELDGKGLSMTIYVHADRAAKQAATGNAGDGHAIGFARALHVRGNVPPAGLELLVAHEATHVLLPQTWGQAGSPLFGEGVAVWVSGQYAGVTLAEWNQKFDRTSKVIDLLGPAFRKLPEASSYPAGGLIVEAIIGEVGLAGLRDHLYGANALTWPAACVAAGTTADKLDAAIAALLKK